MYSRTTVKRTYQASLGCLISIGFPCMSLVSWAFGGPCILQVRPYGDSLAVCKELINSGCKCGHFIANSMKIPMATLSWNLAGDFQWRCLWQFPWKFMEACDGGSHETITVPRIKPWKIAQAFQLKLSWCLSGHPDGMYENYDGRYDGRSHGNNQGELNVKGHAHMYSSMS